MNPPFNPTRRGRVEGNDFTRSMIVRGKQKTKLVRSVAALISMRILYYVYRLIIIHLQCHTRKIARARLDSVTTQGETRHTKYHNDDDDNDNDYDYDNYDIKHGCTCIRTKREIHARVRHARIHMCKPRERKGKEREEKKSGGAAIEDANIVRKKRARCNHVPIRFHI